MIQQLTKAIGLMIDSRKVESYLSIRWVWFA